MRCPQCHCQSDKVIDSRSSKDGEGVRRRRQCESCGHRFTTYEEIVQVELKVIKRDEIREEFDREKLRKGIDKACWKRPVSRENIDRLVSKLVKEIEMEYEREVSTDAIGQKVMRSLKELDEVAYVRFASVYRKFSDVDEFINEIKTMNESKL